MHLDSRHQKICCHCTHPEALTATGNEKEHVVCVPTHDIIKLPGCFFATHSVLKYHKQCVMHAVSLPLISHCFETRWQMRSLSFSSSPLQGLPNQYTAPLPASDGWRDFSSAAVEQNKTHPVSYQSCIATLQLFSANSSFSYVSGYFLFSEVAYTSYCLKGTLLQSTYSDIFAEESTKELCEEARQGQEPARHGSHRSSGVLAIGKAGDSKHALL